ncbi:MFS general substrate transporter [Cystobasidium minutum MCA 4210]|uniref:MFS general substrate transporter n=1 Tax=Cystobasidium minutum MCA 4210 TaxID=1397322 RepID=UPI0034CD1D9E|eukprot:jgi/Rhomi1/13451/CE13450_1361
MATVHASSAPHLLDKVSPGVRRIQAISSCFTTWHRWVLFVSIFLVAYAYGLDGTVRYTYQGYATAGFGQHSLLATVSTVRSIVAAASQPAYAKISDVFGRIPILVFCTVIYVVGTIIEATSHSVGGFSGGAILYQFGYTGIILLVEVLIADTTTLRNRLLASYIPALPFLINAFLSGNVTSSTLETTTWQWGIGMWAIVFPVCTIPLFISLLHAERRAKKKGLLEGIPSPYKAFLRKQDMIELFWQIDLVGLVLLAASMALILLPFTLAGGVSSQWKTAKIIAMLVIGFVVALPAFLIWEKKFAKHPLVPFYLLKERTVLAGLVLAMMLNGSWYLQGDFGYTILYVAFDQSVLSATRISSLYSFTSVCVGVALGIATRYIRRLKWFVVGGACLFMVAFGILLHFRGGGAPGAANVAGYIGGQILLGVSGGLIPYSVQALVQAATAHENVAMITALYLATYNVGSALGFTVSGAIWTQTLYSKLNEALAPINATLAADVYGSPYVFADTYPVGTPERDAVIHAYQQVQRLLIITGLCMSTVLIIAALFLRDYYLVDAQSRPEAEEQASGVRKDSDSFEDAKKDSVTP